jgi:transposase-like protein
MRKTGRSERTRQEETVQISLEDLLRSQLHDFVVDAGQRVLQALLEEERTAVCGPRYQHQGDRQAYRSGHAPGELALGGQRVTVRRPRARTVDGTEVELPTWRDLATADPLSERTLEQMVMGVSTRNYYRSLETLPETVSSRGASRSAVSRRFVKATQERLNEVLSRDLSGLDLLVLMIDGVHFSDHVVLTAVGIDSDGHKHVVGLQEGATENAAACRSLLTNLRQRGLDTERSILVVVDGSKALVKAVRDVFGSYALVQRCRQHKRRNVRQHLPRQMWPSVKRAMNEAYKTGKPERARQLLLNLARRLEDEHPGAAASLREGLDDTLTVMGRGLSKTLERMLSTTNAIENLMGSVRRVSRRVKRWTGGKMILRWMAAGVEEAARGFRRVRGYRDLVLLDRWLRENDAKVKGLVEDQAA